MAIDTPPPPTYSDNVLGPILDDGNMSIRIFRKKGLWSASFSLRGQLIGIQTVTTWEQCMKIVNDFVEEYVLAKEAQ